MFKRAGLAVLLPLAFLALAGCNSTAGTISLPREQSEVEIGGSATVNIMRPEPGPSLASVNLSPSQATLLPGQKLVFFRSGS